MPNTVLAAPAPAPSPAATSKRKAADDQPRAAKRLGSADAASKKPKQTKSRNGCSTCKAKRLKCDEAKPTCHQCARRNVPCGGYKKELKWKFVGEETLNAKPPAGNDLPSPASSTAGSVHASSRPPFSRWSADGLVSPLDQPMSYAFESSVVGQPRSQPPLRTTGSHLQTQDISTDAQRTQLPTPVHTPSYLHYGSHPQPPPTPPYEQVRGYGAVSIDQNATQQHFEGRGPDVQKPTFTGRSPTLSELLLPGTDFKTGLPASDTGNYSQDNGSQTSSLTLTYNGVEPFPKTEDDPIALPLGDDDDDIEEVVPVSRHPTTILKEPRFAPCDPEMLMSKFDRDTSAIMCIKEGPDENPWRSLIWPLVWDNPVLYHAMASMTCFHSSRYSPALRTAGIQHMRESLCGLARNMSKMRTETALATTLALAFSDSWDQHISTGIDHIKAANQLVRQRLGEHRRKPLEPDELRRMRFLCKTWIYIDVLARLTCGEDDVSLDFEQVAALIDAPADAADDADADADVDPLMGAATTLFPVIGRVANLVRRASREKGNSPAVVAEAAVLKDALEGWAAPVLARPYNGPPANLADSLQTAEAYRWATLLYLHQAVPEIPMETSFELARRSLAYLAAVPLTSRTVIVHIYPLLAAGCEARSEEERAWVSHRWESMIQRMAIGNVDRCFDVVREVWDRRDRHAQALGRSLLDVVMEDEDDFSVRGRLHWVGVMKEWNWEVLLG